MPNLAFGMELAVAVARWTGILLVFALLGSVAVRVITGGLRTQGLIDGTTSSGSQFVSAARLQMLIATLLVAANYLTQVWHNPQQLPDIQRDWLLLLGGSHSLYHVNKFNGKRQQRFDI